MSTPNPTHPDTPDEPRNPAADDDAAYDLTPDGEEPTPDGSASGGGPSDGVQQRFDALQAERDELEQKLLRTAADYQNFIRRANQNVDSARQESLSSVAKSMVTVLDHFDRALQLDAETTSTADVLGGVRSIKDELLRALERFGLTRLDVEPGTEFDPNLHEALMRQPSDDVESGSVAAQFQPGYLLNDRPIRPAQVSVAE